MEPAKPLNQKHLDKLRQEYRLLLKGSFAKDMTAAQRAARRAEIERLLGVDYSAKEDEK